MKTKSILLSFFIVTIFIINLSAQQCTIKEENLQIKTYPFSDPDPVPILVKNPAIYPYFKYEKYSVTGKNRSWKVVTLENANIKVIVLPEVGGKVVGAIEKSTQREFLYYNKVLKFRQIAMRGPWTSGGSEFNFGIVGHTPTVATPVDYFTRENPDGSVSCFVGTMDLTSRTRWSVEIRLPKDKAYFETRTSWYNPTPFNQSYYSWSNNAVKAGEDLEYFYPGKYRRAHGYSVPMIPWPVDEEGRNLSFYKNNNFGSHKSHFVMGEYENFFGGYWHDSDFGFGHWALYDDMPGKKMWIWAQSRQGAIWENLLTDTDGQYSEPQAGRLFSQDDHEFFSPYSVDTWKEILFPFKGTGGMVKSSPFAVLNIVEKNNLLVIKICPLQTFTDTLVVMFGDDKIYNETILFTPMDVVERTIPISPSAQAYFQISISDKIRYNSNPVKNDINRPFSYQVIDESTTEGIYLAAERLEKRRQYDQALKKYIRCLDRDPYHIRAMVRAAEIYCRKAENQRAFTYAGSALKMDMYDAGANYIYGVIARKTGDLVDAKETLGWAARSMKYRSNAYCQLAEICLIEKDYKTALDYIQKSIDYNSINSRPREIQAILFRKLHRQNDAEKVLSKILDNDPLNHLARFELFLNQPDQQNLNQFKSFIQNEIPHETYLEMALTYVNLGLDDEAIKLCENSIKNPTINYWLAYLYRNQNSEKSKSFLIEANRLSPELVFPFRNESIPVFKWAIKNSLGKWKPYYYLGLIYWSKDRVAEAKQLFENCSKPDFAPFYIIQAHLNKNLALVYYLEALTINNKDWRNWHYIIKYYNKNLQYQKALEIAAKAVDKFRDDIVITMDYALSLYNNQKYEKCHSLLTDLIVLPYEGGWEAHDLYKRVNIQLAMKMMKKNKYKDAVKFLEESKNYPENLGTGKPYHPDYRLQDYLLSICYKNLKEPEKEKTAIENVTGFTIRNWESNLRHNLFGYLSLRASGEQDKVSQLEREWQTGKNNQQYRWFLTKLKKVQPGTQGIDKKQANNPRFSIVKNVVDFLENEGYLE